MYEVVADGTSETYEKIGRAEDAVMEAIFFRNSARVELWERANNKLREVIVNGETIFSSW